MIKAETIREILSLYQKYGWQLRRVLLSDEYRVQLNDQLQNLFGGVPIVSSRLNAAWFSRSSPGAQEAWEIRHLSATPFAYVEVLPTDMPADEREAVLRATENRLLAAKG